jgi:16S rRNA C967 or C1407 C5-methylase (RsmB/RsmF family)
VQLRRPDKLAPDARLTEDYLQLWPHRHDTDAMFAAVLERHPH